MKRETNVIQGAESTAELPGGMTETRRLKIEDMRLAVMIRCIDGWARAAGQMGRRGSSASQGVREYLLALRDRELEALREAVAREADPTIVERKAPIQRIRDELPQESRERIRELFSRIEWLQELEDHMPRESQERMNHLERLERPSDEIVRLQEQEESSGAAMETDGEASDSIRNGGCSED